MKIKSPQPSGIALVIVLGFLVLISVLVVAFFSSVTTELKASRNFSSSVTTRQLAESATQVVMGQIREATTRNASAWASQPGMIRTYRTNATTPGPEADSFYKLYSSNKMVLTGGLLQDFSSANYQDFDDRWNEKPALWVDLNSPVLVQNPEKSAEHPGATVPRFPIIDPRAYAIGATSRYATVPKSQDPLHKNTEGFWYGAEDAADPVPVGLVGPGGAGGDAQRLPMPVRWLYVLQDGTLTSPNDAAPLGDSTGTVARWTMTATGAAKVPTRENPIVGRIAFWADDETSKVNLNTAAGYVDPTMDPNLDPYAGYDVTTYAGSYWDTPRFYTEFDRGMPYREGLGSSGSIKAGTPVPGGGGLAICQLLQNEFQRYPGHPMTTSLGLILGPYMKTTGGPEAGNPFTRSEQMYTILPRIGTTAYNKGMSQPAGSTKGGMIRIVPFNPTLDNKNLVPEDLMINARGDRLFASVDELYYAADSSTPSASPVFKRDTVDKYLKTSANPLPGSAVAISADNVDKLRFFLTTQSRAPELNLFGRPRVTIWPVRFENATESSGLNPFDNVILFCSTIGTDPNANANGRPNMQKAPTAAQSPLQLPNFTPVPTGINAGPPYRYIFTRRELPANLVNLAGVTKDIDLPRNKQLMLYLQRLTSRAIPGFGSSFLAKYEADGRDQILTEIFDYIRCANIQDTTKKTVGGVNATAKMFSPKGLVLPSKPTYLQAGKVFSGFGRVPIVNEATLVFYYAGPKMLPAAPTATPPMPKPYVETDEDGFVKTRRMRAFFLLSMFNPMQGYGPTRDPGTQDPKITLKVTNLHKFRVVINGIEKQCFFPETGTTTVYRSSQGAWGGRNFGGFEGFMHTLVGPPLYKIKEKVGQQETAQIPLAKPYNYLTKANSAGTALETAEIGAGQQELYPFQTPGSGSFTATGTFDIEYDNQQTVFDFKGAHDITVEVAYGGVPIQTATLDFPDSKTSWPLPKGDPGREVSLVATDTAGHPTTNHLAVRPTSKPVKEGTTLKDLRDPDTWGTVLPGWSNGQTFLNIMKMCYWEHLGSFYTQYLGRATLPNGHAPYMANPDQRTSISASWAFASRLAWSMQPSHAPWKNKAGSTVLNSYGDRWRQIVQPGDTIRSVVYCETPMPNPGPTSSGDLRLGLIGPVNGDPAVADFKIHPDYHTMASRATALRLADGNMYFPWGSNAGAPHNPSNLNKEPSFGNHVGLGNNQFFPPSRAVGNLPFGAKDGANGGVTRVTRADGGPGDFDTGIGNLPDGPYLNKPDEGNVIFAYLDEATQEWRYPVPYFSTWAYEEPGNTFTSPSRQMPGPGMIGSLPSRAHELQAGKRRGWETLNLRPDMGTDSHPGNLGVKDHLLMDLFQMPVVEPYPISEPFSTAGKVNMNYQIQPFSYITRSTALRAALHSVRVTAVPQVNYIDYKSGTNPSGSTAIASRDQYDSEKGTQKPIPSNFRKILDRDMTIRGFDEFFRQGIGDPDDGFFKSATQICERYLYPFGMGLPSDNAVKGWWGNFTLGGDNTKEKPYVDLYPRLTTKSNTFTVHMRVQVLRQRPRDNAAAFATWEEGRDSVLGEYRGATTIERYIDPADPRFDPNNPTANGGFADPDDALSVTNLEGIYRFRSVINKKFAPY